MPRTRRHRRRSHRGGDPAADQEPQPPAMPQPAPATPPATSSNFLVISPETRALMDNFQNLRLLKGFKAETTFDCAECLCSQDVFAKDGQEVPILVKVQMESKFMSVPYEFLVGKLFVNLMLHRFPCFVETLLRLEFHPDKDAQILPLRDLQEYWQHACTNSANQAILLQHRVPTISFQDILTKQQYEADRTTLMFQLYFTLVALFPRFTHNYLGPEAARAFRPFGEREYLVMRFHDTCTGTLVEFPTEYIAQMVDCGHSYFSNQEQVVGSFPLPDSEFVAAGIPAEQVASLRTNTDRMARQCIIPVIRSCKPFDYSPLNGLGYVVGDARDSEEDKLRSVFSAYGEKPNPSSDVRYLLQLYEPTMLNLMMNPDQYRYKTRVHFDHDQTIFRTLNVLISKLSKPQAAELLRKKYTSEWKQRAVLDVYDDGRPYTLQML